MPPSRDDFVLKFLLQTEILVLNPVELECFIAADNLSTYNYLFSWQTQVLNWSWLHVWWLFEHIETQILNRLQHRNILGKQNRFWGGICSYWKKRNREKSYRIFVQVRSEDSGVFFCSLVSKRFLNREEKKKLVQLRCERLNLFVTKQNLTELGGVL